MSNDAKRDVKEISLSHEQSQAVEMCADLGLRIFSVTGGAGTGKTSVLGYAYQELVAEVGKENIVLAAPTGRAAKRIQELTGIPAKTIHRLLEFPSPEAEQEIKVIDEETGETRIEKIEAIEGQPRRNNGNPIIERVVIIDEASMLGPTLYAQLIDALRGPAVIRFFGDNNQLPPVEAGLPPFVTLLREAPAVTLTLNFRSDDAIIGNALRILRGSIPLRNSRFEIIYSDDPIKQLYALAGNERETFTSSRNQIIMPTRRGNFGTQRVNPTLQQAYNPSGEYLRLERLIEKEAPIVVRAHDKFLWTKNDYNLNLFNGDTGVIDGLNAEDGHLSLGTDAGNIAVPARLRGYNSYLGRFQQYDPRKAIELGYAVTTHKAQGSEFNSVVYCITRAQGRLLNKQNFYTAVTRARERVVVICDRTAIARSVRPAMPF